MRRPLSHRAGTLGAAAFVLAGASVPGFMLYAFAEDRCSRRLPNKLYERTVARLRRVDAVARLFGGSDFAAYTSTCPRKSNGDVLYRYTTPAAAPAASVPRQTLRIEFAIESEAAEGRVVAELTNASHPGPRLSTEFSELASLVWDALTRDKDREWEYSRCYIDFTRPRRRRMVIV